MDRLQIVLTCSRERPFFSLPNDRCGSYQLDQIRDYADSNPERNFSMALSTSDLSHSSGIALQSSDENLIVFTTALLIARLELNAYFSTLRMSGFAQIFNFPPHTPSEFGQLFDRESSYKLKPLKT